MGGSGKNTAGSLNPGSGLTGTNGVNLQQLLAGLMQNNASLLNPGSGATGTNAATIPGSGQNTAGPGNGLTETNIVNLKQLLAGSKQNNTGLLNPGSGATGTNAATLPGSGQNTAGQKEIQID